MAIETYASVEAFHEDKNKISWDLSKGLWGTTLSITRMADFDSRHTPGKQFTQPWTGYQLTGLPGCCGVVVSHSSWLDHDKRGGGLGDHFHKERLDLIKELGYSCALATVVSTNMAEKHILEKNNWKKVHEFKNSRTDNTVEIWVRNND